MKCFPGISNFIEEISSLPHSIIFLYSLHCFLGRPSYLSMIKVRNDKDLTEAEEIKNTQNNCTKKLLMTKITMMVWSPT